MKKFNRMLIAVAIWMLCLITGVNGQIVTEIPLYPEDPEFNPENRKEEHKFDAEGKLTRVFGLVVPRLLVYKPEKACGTGIIICPGGGFSTLNVETTRCFAERLNRMGVTVFVLVYRLTNLESKYKDIDAPLMDVQTAFHMVRSRADEWGLSKNKIGIWGNSAGGNLAAMAATHYLGTSYIPGIDITEFRPDFVVLHSSSGRKSPDEWVDSETPPTIIVHASDDPVLNPSGAILFYESLKKSNVPVELHIYEKGGHGFGYAPDIKDKDSWVSQLEIWLRNRGLL
jgi:acetyl esterase/lipase